MMCQCNDNRLQKTPTIIDIEIPNLVFMSL